MIVIIEAPADKKLHLAPLAWAFLHKQDVRIGPFNRAGGAAWCVADMQEPLPPFQIFEHSFGVGIRPEPVIHVLNIPAGYRKG